MWRKIVQFSFFFCFGFSTFFFRKDPDSFKHGHFSINASVTDSIWRFVGYVVHLNMDSTNFCRMSDFTLWFWMKVPYSKYLISSLRNFINIKGKLKFDCPLGICSGFFKSQFLLFLSFVLQVALQSYSGIAWSELYNWSIMIVPWQHSWNTQFVKNPSSNVFPRTS